MRLLISGYYGFANLGDEALLTSLLQQLGEYEVTVLSGDPARTTREHRVHAVHRYTGFLGPLMRSDALIFGGGGLLQDRTSQRSLTYYTTLIRIAKLLRKRVVLVGQSLGPLTVPGLQTVQRALKGVALGVRDDESLALAESLGVPATFTPDLALALEAPETLHNPGGPVVFVPRADEPAFTQLQASVVRSLQDVGVAVSAVAFQPSDTAAELGIPVTELSHTDEFFHAIHGASAVVSVRLHGVILAATANIPAVALSYDPKVSGFAAYAGLPVAHADIEPEHLTQMVLETRPQPPAEADRFRAEARNGFRWLKSQLTNAHDGRVH